MRVSEVNITPVKPVNGLVAFASCVVNEEFFVGSIGVHTRPDGTSYRITYPGKRIGLRNIDYFHPITRKAGMAIEQAISNKCTQLFKRSDDGHGRHSKAFDSSS